MLSGRARLLASSGRLHLGMGDGDGGPSRPLFEHPHGLGRSVTGGYTFGNGDLFVLTPGAIFRIDPD